jgi:hypothetical protein
MLANVVAIISRIENIGIVEFTRGVETFDWKITLANWNGHIPYSRASRTNQCLQPSHRLIVELAGGIVDTHRCTRLQCRSISAAERSS